MQGRLPGNTPGRTFPHPQSRPRPGGTSGKGPKARPRQGSGQGSRLVSPPARATHGAQGAGATARKHSKGPPGAGRLASIRRAFVPPCPRRRPNGAGNPKAADEGPRRGGAPVFRPPLLPGKGGPAASARSPCAGEGRGSGAGRAKGKRPRKRDSPASRSPTARRKIRDARRQGPLPAAGGGMTRFPRRPGGFTSAPHGGKNLLREKTARLRGSFRTAQLQNPRAWRP